MNRTLILIRHAKSSWKDTDLSDKERPLAGRGKRDAPMMGKRLAERQVKPDLILSSPAQRALATAKIIVNELGYNAKDIVVDERLYATDADALLAVIGEITDTLKCVMLFGHNPELSELAHQFSREIELLPTCAVAQFTFETASWANLGAAKPEDVVLDYPKNK